MNRCRATTLAALAMSGCIYHGPVFSVGRKTVPVRVESEPANELSVKAQFVSAAGDVQGGACEFVPCTRCIRAGTLLVGVSAGTSRYERHVVIPDTPARVIIKRNRPAAFHLGYSLILSAIGLLGGAGGTRKAEDSIIQNWWVDPHWQDKLAFLQVVDVSFMVLAAAMIVTGVTLTFTNMKRDRIEVKPWPHPPAELAGSCRDDTTTEQAGSVLPPVAPPENPRLREDLLVVRGMLSAAPFLIEKTEVTVDMYQRCVRAGRCTEPDRGQDCIWGVRGRGHFPVNCVDQAQAAAYCAFLQRRLPRDEEWQHLLAIYGTLSGNIHKLEQPQEGGLQPAGAFGETNGIRDLIGNVWEWSASPSGMSWGGSFDSMLPERGGPSSLKNAVSVTTRLPTIGFRCAADLPQEPRSGS